MQGSPAPASADLQGLPLTAPVSKLNHKAKKHKLNPSAAPFIPAALSRATSVASLAASTPHTPIASPQISEAVQRPLVPGRHQWQALLAPPNLKSCDHKFCKACFSYPTHSVRLCAARSSLTLQWVANANTERLIGLISSLPFVEPLQSGCNSVLLDDLRLPSNIATVFNQMYGW